MCVSLADAAAQPGGPDPTAGAELGQRARAGRRQRGQQTAGLVAAERHEPRAPGHVERTTYDVRQVGWGAHPASLAECGNRSSGRDDVSHAGKLVRRPGGERAPVDSLAAPCGSSSYLSSAAARPLRKATSPRWFDSAPTLARPYENLRSEQGGPPEPHSSPTPRRPRNPRPRTDLHRRPRSRPHPPRPSRRRLARHPPTTTRTEPFGVAPMYDMYPEWGPSRHRDDDSAAARRPCAGRRPGRTRPARQRRRAAGRQLVLLVSAA